MLGTSSFASAAIYAIINLSLNVIRLKLGIVAPGIQLLRYIIASEISGNGNIHRATLGAIIAGGALNEILRAEDLCHLGNTLSLLVGKGHKILHIAHVIKHHLHRSHTGKNHTNLVEACGKSDGVGSVGAVAESAKNIVSLLREIHQASALNRLHYHSGDAVLHTNLVALSRLYRGILVVKIVELNLRNLNLGILGQDIVKHVCSIVEGETEMANLAFLLKLDGSFICAASLVMLEVILILSVHKIEVEILYSASLKLNLKEGTNVLLTVKVVGRELICKNISVARVAACKALLNRGLTLAIMIAVSGIEVVESCFKECIEHLLNLRDVNLLAHHRKSHTAESELAVYLGKMLVCHIIAPKVFSYIIP